MHQHTAASIATRPYSGPVAAFNGTVTRDENRAAHGNVCEVERCACGAVRHVNVNGRHTEEGPWRMPAQQPPRETKTDREIAKAKRIARLREAHRQDAWLETDHALVALDPKTAHLPPERWRLIVYSRATGTADSYLAWDLAGYTSPPALVEAAALAP